eukprot:9853671-Lingulodinium_polyedra.AAC.1
MQTLPAEQSEPVLEVPCSADASGHGGARGLRWQWEACSAMPLPLAFLCYLALGYQHFLAGVSQ